MDRQDPIVVIGNLALLAGWVFMSTFVVRYSILSSWRQEKAGRALMGFMAATAAVLTYVVVAILTGGFYAQVPIRTMLFVLFAFTSGRFLRLLLEVQSITVDIPQREKRTEKMSLAERIKRFFRREPTLYVGLTAAILNWLVGFQLDFLTAEQASLWMLAVNAGMGVWAAIKTRPIAPQAFTYFVTSLAGIGAAYGMDYSQEQVGQFNALVLAVMIFITREQVSPKSNAESTGVLGNKVTTD